MIAQIAQEREVLESPLSDGRSVIELAPSSMILSYMLALELLLGMARRTRPARTAPDITSNANVGARSKQSRRGPSLERETRKGAERAGSAIPAQLRKPKPNRREREKLAQQCSLLDNGDACVEPAPDHSQTP